MKLLTSIIVFLIVLVSCKKSNITSGNTSGNTNSDSTNVPFVTLQGVPVGDPVTAAIGASGGSIKSSDGRVQLVIPAGALTQTLNITIQPITNMCPGGIGVAYDLLPNGTKFSIPATITFNYSDSELKGSNPLLLESVFQDSANAWEMNDVEKDMSDTANKRISYDISHFSSWTWVPRILIDVNPEGALEENRTAVAKVQVWLFPSDSEDHGGRFVQGKFNVSNSTVQNWRVDPGYQASGDIGTITGNGNTAIYKAPADIPKDQLVEISCHLNKRTYVKIKGQGTVTLDDMRASGYVALYSGILHLDIMVKIILNQSSFFIPDIYTDSATLHVDAKYGDITISKIVNAAPSVQNGLGTYGNSTVVWVPDLIGVMHITSAVGTLIKNPLGPYFVKIDLTHTGTVYPKWLLRDSQGGTQTTGGNAVPGEPPYITIDAINRDQFKTSSLGIGLDKVEVTVTATK